jgi:hypothetical protein
MSTCTLKTLPDGLEVVTPRSLRLALLTVVLTALVGVELLGELDGFHLAVALVTALPLPFLWVLALRAAANHHVRLKREGGRVFCNGEELEVARIENRVVLSLFQVPRAYSLSLWGLTVEGRAVEVALGELPDLFASSKMAGTLEDFLAQTAAAPKVMARR